MERPVRLLMVEDVAADAELAVRELKRAGMRVRRQVVDTEDGYVRALAEFEPELILSDFGLPRFDGMRALALARERRPEVPFIFVSGTIGEDYAIRALKNGATDYVLKSNLVRLPVAVERALHDSRRNASIREAQRALAANEAGLRRAQAMAGLAHVVSSLDGAFESWSESLPRMLGLAPAAMPRSTRAWLELIHPDDRAVFRGRAIDAGRSGTRGEFEYRIQHADGSWVQMKQVTEPLDASYGDADGQRWFGTLQDVTAQRQAEAAMKESEARYRATFEQAAVGIVHTSLGGDLRMVNQTFCEMCGLTRAEAVQLHIREVTHPEDFRPTAEARAQILEGEGKPYQREMRLARRDGSHLWVSVTTSVMRDAAGKPMHFVSVLSDISERKRMEETLRDAEQRYRAIFENSIEGIFQSTREGRVIACNPAHARIMGYGSPEEYVAAVSDAPTQVYVDPQDRRRLMQLLDAQGSVHGFETRFRRKDGSIIWSSMSVRAVKDRAGAVSHLLGVVQDTNARVLAERELRRFQASMDITVDSIYLTDPETMRFLYVNDTACRRLGYSREELMQKTSYEVVGKSRAEVHREYRAVIAAGEKGTSSESRFVRKDGSDGWTELHRRALTMEGEIVIVTIGRDITERVRSEEELRRFRLAMDASADVIFLVDHATMRNVDCNDTACRLLGYTREELLQMGPHDILPFTREELKVKYDEMIATQSTKAGVRSYYRRKDGSHVPFESTRQLLRSGDSWLIVAVARDIRDRLASENALRESEARFRSLTELSSDFYWESDAEHRMLRVSHGSQHRPVIGTTQIGKRRWESPSTRPDAAGWAAHRALLDARQPFRDFEIARLDAHGVERFLSVSGEPVFDESGAFKGYRGIGKDVTENKTQQKRIERLSRVHALLSGINAAIVRIRDRNELYREACRVATEEGGFKMAWAGVVAREAGRIEPVAWQGADEAYIRSMPLKLAGTPSLSGLAVRERRPVVSDDMAQDPRVQLQAEAAARGFHSLAILPLTEGGEIVGVLALYSAEAGFFDEHELKLLNELAGDISFALEVIGKEEKLNYLALHDPLTGLANRGVMVERLGQSIQSAAQAGAKFALAWFDIERLTTVNESLGRQVGDALIRQVGERLARAAGATAVGRIAADHFVAILPVVKGRSEAGRIATNVTRACFSEAYALQGTELKVAAKAGLALFPNDGMDAEALLANAEAALRKAKETGERQVFYTPDLTERTGVSLTLENKLRRALENDEFVLHYQPKIDVETRRIAGMEALIRWQSPELGLVPPGKFIPLMEETGMILDAGTWALKRASLDHARWTELKLRPPRVAVNVSAIQLRQKDFVAAVEQAIMEGVAPTGIDLEITESLIMEDIEGNIGKLREVRGLGIGLAIDDFGTGYSSLSYLAKLPVQTLKIDRSFVITMLNEPDTMTLVQTIISLAHSLRLKVVAEGVDAEEQAKVLRLLRCDEMQGFLFSKPVPFEALTALLESSRELRF